MHSQKRPSDSFNTSGGRSSTQVQEANSLRAIKGSGLGLAIAKMQLTELHGGCMTIRSTLGVGTAVHIQLPNRSTDAIVGGGLQQTVETRSGTLH